MFFWELWLASLITRPRETTQHITINVNINETQDEYYDEDEEEDLAPVHKGEHNNVIPFTKPRN